MGILDKIFGNTAGQPDSKKQENPDGGIADALKQLTQMKPAEIKSTRKGLESIRRSIEAHRAEEKSPLKATEEDGRKYERIKIQNYVKDFKGTIQSGELLIARMLDSSKVTVMHGGALRVVDSAMDSEITKESGAEVDIAKMDASVTIIDKAPKFTNCPNCGAPLSGSSCSHCGTRA